MNKILNFKGFVNEMVDEKTLRMETKKEIENRYNKYAKLWGVTGGFTAFYGYLHFMAMLKKNSHPDQNAVAINVVNFLFTVSIVSAASNWFKKISVKYSTKEFIDNLETLRKKDKSFNFIEKELIQQKNELIEKIDLFYDNHNKLFEEEGVDIVKFMQIFSTTSIFKKIGSPYNYIKGNNLLKEHSYIKKDITDIQKSTTKIQYNVKLHVNKAIDYMDKIYNKR